MFGSLPYDRSRFGDTRPWFRRQRRVKKIDGNINVRLVSPGHYTVTYTMDGNHYTANLTPAEASALRDSGSMKMLHHFHNREHGDPGYMYQLAHSMKQRMIETGSTIWDLARDYGWPFAKEIFRYIHSMPYYSGYAGSYLAYNYPQQTAAAIQAIAGSAFRNARGTNRRLGYY